MDIGQTSATTAAPVASLKNKKAIFKQQSLGLDQAVSTISERLNFHTYLQSVTEPLTEFPVAHLPLIAKLIHESEETYHHAATRVHKLLTAQAPSANATESGEPALSKSVVEAAVKKLADRVNWGVDNGVASATLWRLEVKDRDMLPPEFRQVCEERWKERNRAKADIQAALSALPEPDRAQYLKSGGNTASTSTLADKDVVMKSPSKADKAGESSTKKGAGKSKKVVDVETTAKEKEKQEKKSAKEEKDKKVAEDTKKRAAAFASFFTPARPATTRIKPAQDAELSDWQKTFYPFIVKKDTVIAPINRFAQSAPRKSSNPGNALEQLLGQRLPKSRQTLVSSRPRQNLEVRAIMQELTDAEVVGDSKTVRRLTNLLKNRRALPAKLLHFRENARPAYYGTWTRSSPHIGPRRPFGKDESLDYDYDSGEDWEEEGDGEVIVSDGSDEEDSGSDEDEEGWLVDDDEAEGPDDAMDESSDTAVKRKVKSSNEKDTKRRRVEKLTPFQKGPCWEEGIGECSYDAFNAYRIQLLNDCPYPVDPFTFIPAKLEEPAPTKAENATAAAQAPTFAVPVAPGTDEASRPPVPGTLNRVPSLAKKQIDPASIKHPFPEIYLSELYSLIEGSEKTLKGLVEDLYLALKKYPGVKKYAIEAKLREVADKGRSADTPAKRWRVSDEAWAAIGVARPGPS